MLALVLTITAIWVVALIGGALGSIFLRARLVRRLKEFHALVWAELGSPASVAHDSGVVWKWVWERKYEGLGDPETTRIARMLRITVSVLLVAVVLAILLALTGKFLT